MAKNGNTVNIGSAGERYHHGDLRRALVLKGMERLAEGPAEDLSLRELARSVGLPATAVYRHFPDKAALLTELCIEGDRMLAEAFRKAMAKVKPGMEAFDEMGRAYVRFALAHPAIFRLMMSPAGVRRDEGEASTMVVGALKGGMHDIGRPGTAAWRLVWESAWKRCRLLLHPHNRPRD